VWQLEDDKLVITEALNCTFANMKHLLSLFCCVLLAIACSDKKDPNKNGDSKELPEYILKLQERVSKYPDSVGLHIKLADAYDSLGLFKEGIAQLDSVLKRDSANNAVWMRKGQLLEKAKDTTGAMYSYLRTIKIYPAVDAQL